MSAHLERAQLLLSQERYEAARDEAAKALQANPDDAGAYVVLSSALLELKQTDQAIEAGRRAVALAPYALWPHLTLAQAYKTAERYEEALFHASEGVRVDPLSEDSWGVQAGVFLAMSQWAKAAEAAERGLKIDPEDVFCSNIRAHALTMLGRRDEAGLTVNATLALDPEVSWSHANKGWNLLHQSRPKEAMLSFREALRLDPNNEWARQGIVEAIKAHNFFYRQMLRYFLWMARLSPGVRIAVIVGLYFVIRLLRNAQRAVPSIEPYVTPLIILYGILAFLTWTAPTLANLLLRLHPTGRYALSPAQVRAANFVGAFLLAGIVTAGIGAWLRDVHYVVGGALLAAMILPVSGTFTAREGKRRNILAIGAALLTALIVLGLLVPHPFYAPIFGIAMLGIVVFAWIAMFMIMSA